MKERDFSIRPAAPADVAELAELSRLCFAEPWSRDSFATEFSVPGGEIWLASGGGRALGYLVSRRVLDQVEVLSLGVRSEHRRLDIAASLLERTLQGDSSGSTVHLEVREGNRGARAFYRALRFEEVGSRRNYYPGGENAVLLSRVQPGALRGSA